jgi:glycogen debranching enzyme
MRFKSPLSPLLLLLFLGCTTAEQPLKSPSLEQAAGLPSIAGQPQYLASPFVTAGDRVYLVGHQDGSFPDLGWHIDGEMGGIWNHPIKLMDGFAATLSLAGGGATFCLDKADQFTNYSMANSHHFSWKEQELAIERFQFVPDAVEGLVVEFRITNRGNAPKELLFSFTGLTDLRPTWLGERTNMIDAEDVLSYDENASAVLARDQKNPWFTMFGSSLPASQFSTEATACQPPSRRGLGREGTLSYTLSLAAGEERVIPIFIAGSYQSEEALRSTYALLKEEAKELFQQKSLRYKRLQAGAQLSIPDKDLEQMYEWLKYNTDWLIRHVPELGVGLTAGLPDYPWWFGADAAYALQGVLATGDHALVRNTILLLHQLSVKTNNNGRIIHEVSTNGAVYNPGNVNETAQFISLVYTYWAWTGDTELVKEVFPNLKKGLNWLLQEMDPDGNGYPNGSGMMEIPGLEEDLELIDVAVYTQQALASAARLARAMGETALATTYQQQADALKERINKEWWQAEKQSYGDFRGTVEEALPVLEAALIRSDTLGKPLAVAELQETQERLHGYPEEQPLPHVIYHNWVVNTPMETGIADPEKGRAALKTAKTFENPFGVYVTGIDRTDEPDSIVLKSRKKTFSYIGAVMTLPTGVQAVAAAQYGSPEEALDYLHMLHRSFSYALPGSMYEVSPDFGMFTQAWNIYGVAVPIIQHFFGIQPKAYEKRIILSPNMPKEWPEAGLERVKVGNNFLSLSIRQQEDHTEYQLQQTEGDWTLSLPLQGIQKAVLNGRELDAARLSRGTLELTGNENRLQLYPAL